MKDLQPSQCSRLLRILADPQRLRIIQCLSEGAKNVSELANLLDKHVVKVSHHLAVLRKVGLVQRDRQGRFVIYRLNPEVYTRGGGKSPLEYLDLGCCRLETASGHDKGTASQTRA